MLLPDRAATGPHFVPGLPHVTTLIELRLALISYQDYHMMLIEVETAPHFVPGLPHVLSRSPQAAGPFGSPDRFGGSNSPRETVEGGWERTIGTHHSIVSLVMEARAWLPDPGPRPAPSSLTRFFPVS